MRVLMRVTAVPAPGACLVTVATRRRHAVQRE